MIVFVINIYVFFLIITEFWNLYKVMFKYRLNYIYIFINFNSFFLIFIYLFIYLFLNFMAVLGPRFCARAFSSCGKWGPLFIAVRGPLTIAASLVVEHRLQMRRLSNFNSLETISI